MLPLRLTICQRFVGLGYTQEGQTTEGNPEIEELLLTSVTTVMVDAGCNVGPGVVGREALRGDTGLELRPTPFDDQTGRHADGVVG